MSKASDVKVDGTMQTGMSSTNGDGEGGGNVKAVQEPGFANVWFIQDGTGSTIARLTVSAQAETWARRIEEALNGPRVETVAQEAESLSGGTRDELSYVADGVRIIEAALTKAELGNLDDAPFGMDAQQSGAYLQGLASAYRHALEMIAPPRNSPGSG